MIDALKGDDDGPAMQPEGAGASGGDLLDAPVDPEQTNTESLEANDDDLEDKIRELLAGKLDDADLEMLIKLIQPEEADEPAEPPAEPPPAEPPAEKPEPEKPAEPPPEKKEGEDKRLGADKEKHIGMDKQAMDAAIKLEVDKGVNEAVRRTTERLNDRAAAEKFVRPWIGELAMAMDTAEDVYRLALETLNVPVKGVHPSAFKAMLALVPKPGEGAQRQRLAHDSAGTKSFVERFPAAARMRVIG